MTLTTPLADDAAILEYSYTIGNSGVYQLAGAWGSYFPFSAEFANGATVTYRATDGSANTEIGTATYSAGANTLTRVSIITSSNGGAAVNWTGRTRILVHSLKRRLAICATPPTVGQVLEWDGTEWCPATPSSGFPLCPTPPTDGQVLIYDAALGEYCPADFCALVMACLAPPPFSAGAVSFDGGAFGWGFPAMADSSSFSMSVWLYVTGTQLASPRTPQGDMFGAATGYLFNDPGDSGQENFVGLGGFRSWHGIGGTDIPINDIVSITRANPAVITFQNPHGIDADTYLQAWQPGVNNPAWATAFTFSGANHITGVGANTITVAVDTSAIASAWNTPSGSNVSGHAGVSFQIYNAMELKLGDSGSKTALFTWGKALPPGQWVNALLNIDTNHAAGAKVATLYFGETAVPISALADTSAAFNMFFSEPDVAEADSWKIGGSYASGAVVCYMAEMWWSAGQLIDFTNSANRAKFHDGSNHPVSLGADGSLPTGTKPTLYLHQPIAPRAAPVRWIDPTGFPAAPGGFPACLVPVSVPLAGASVTSLLTFSMWVDQNTVGDILNIGSSTTNGNIMLYDGVCTVELRNTGSGKFIFHFPYVAGSGANLRVGIDMNHAIGAKIVSAYVNGSAASVTVDTDNTNNLAVDWTAIPGFLFSIFCTSQGYVGDLWIAPGYYVDPGPYFYSAGAPGPLPPTTPQMYFHIAGAQPADDFATNLGSGGAFQIDTPGAHFSLISPTEFFTNASGNGALKSPQFMTKLQLAPVSFP